MAPQSLLILFSTIMYVYAKGMSLNWYVYNTVCKKDEAIQIQWESVLFYADLWPAIVT